MNWHDLIPLFLAGAAMLLIMSCGVLSPRRRAARAYRCNELVPDMSLAVTYRDAPLVPCGRGTKLLVHGECIPLCPMHHKPMTRIV